MRRSLVMALLLVACGGQPETPNGESTQTGPPAPGPAALASSEEEPSADAPPAREPDESPCGGAPSLEAIPLPVAFNVSRDAEPQGVLHIDGAGHLTLESNHGALREEVERMESRGLATFRDGSCGRAYERDHTNFAAAVQRRLISEGFTLAISPP